MFIAKELIAKGLLATAATATAITLGVVYGDNIVKYLSSESVDDLLNGVGLSCNDSTNICSLKSGVTGLNVRLSESSKELNKTLPTAESGVGKIKKVSAQESEGYNKNLKFAIVGGDITLTAPTTGEGSGSSSTITKLEEFETYEIKEDGGKYYFSRKTDVNTEIKKALGLPEACVIPTTVGEAGEGCDISGESFKKINFEGKDGLTAGPQGAKLKISKVTGDFYGKYGLKFVLESNSNTTITNTTQIIKANTNTEFKIKVSPEAATSQGPRAVTLEKAWTVAKLAKKIGVAENGCTLETANPKECTIGATINVYKDGSNHVDGATVTDASNKKLTFLTEQPGYNQGYKFTSANEISLNDPASGVGTKEGTVSIEASTAASYEIKEQTVSGGKKWFLSKRAS